MISTPFIIESFRARAAVVQRPPVDFFFGILGVLVAGYVAALFFSFVVGFELDRQFGLRAELTREVEVLTATLQRKELGLREEYADLLSGMERSSAPIYLTTEKSFASR